MGDPASHGNHERDIEQALIALKKGTQLLKYSRKGKPKFRPFRISSDEKALIWYSHGEEKNLKISSVLKIIPGQRTAVFRRFPRPEKDYLSFSLLYNNGERSLDLICKDKVETELWFAGLKALISAGQHSRRTRSDICDVHVGSDSLPNYRPFGATLEATSSFLRTTHSKSPSKSSDFCLRERPSNLTSSDVGSDSGNMQLRTSTGDGYRLSVSSAPSSSSQGSGPDDIESLGDVYVWGKVWSDGSQVEGSLKSFPSQTDVLLPKALESDVVLDVHQIACGVRHAALVTRQGEVFTWGEEFGGRLGHGIDKDFSRPRLVDFLAVNNVDYVACGEYHTCAVSMTGDLFTWGDGNHNAGLLGHGTNVSHWIPKRVSGPLEGVQVLSVACGTWHSALVTSNGKLYTFGDGTFGVLGHGNRDSIAYPREIESLSGLKTIKVACGTWHTAAIVEVMGQLGANISPRKLFTWGDGDKNRLGHGDKKTRLVPTCIPSLIDYNFHQLACGHSITVALTTSGHVFTMGSTAYGQLGNPLSDGKSPCLVQDKLVGECIEDISCGSYHVAALTSRSEVFTWGKGANGRLGHGDIEDRRAPTLVEALKDRLVKSISCGSNFTTSICIHKWVSGADQSVCTGCRQAFGFTRKRHNCYHCGLVHCHACSSKKALRAALAPTPGKPHRVCDPCYTKLRLSDAGKASTSNRKSVAPRQSIDNRERFDRGDIRSSKILLSSSAEPMNYVKAGTKSDSPLVRVSQVPSLFQMKDVGVQSSLNTLQYALKPVITAAPQPVMTPRPASPYSRKPSPPRSVTPVFSKSIIESLKKTNELLNQEVLKLQSQVKSLRQKCEVQDVELQKCQKRAQDASSVAAEESSKSIVAKEVIKSVSMQLKDMKENISPEVCDNENFKAAQIQLEDFLRTNGNEASNVSSSYLPEPSQQENIVDSGERTEAADQSLNAEDNRQSTADNKEVSHHADNKEVSHQDMENGSRFPGTSDLKEETEHFEPGVYVTFIRLSNDNKVFKTVRFSKKRYSNQQAEVWWRENRDRVLRRYRPHGVETASASGSSHSEPSASTSGTSNAEPSEEAETAPSQ
ncbi:Regulator of chromosome condensation (RCC1) family protein [Thalictrum thalictroides]|uniref:Regulator of chromosome condensation (RCC1) family protein n=1 Tax=Thalictrum thalictroides TaxID=46969 RepID=A0A7J6VJP5_THATH|nr:Regulator of chromosome condensation (RCC1) family protein [Thalictrum thalictroides]